MFQNLFKIALITALLMGFSYIGKGQENLVPNPSFEDTVNCPWNSGQISYATGWTNYSGSVDYYNACVPPGWVSVPDNFYGFQYASSGDAYSGIVTYLHGDTSYSSREAIGGQLTTPLTIGQKYFVSFKVSFTINSFETGRAADKTGILFSTFPYNPSTNPPPVNNFAHVYTDSIITDTANWTTIFGSFTADSAYQYLSIGNFFENSNTDTTVFIPDTALGCCSYYFIDDICISTDSSYCANYIYTGIQEELLKDNFNIYPNPVTNYFQINQTFTEPYDLTIYNSLGQQLYQEKNITTNNKTIDATPFNKGILFINIKSNSKTINYKLLKQ